MSEHGPLADAFLSTIKPGSLWRLNAAGKSFHFKISVRRFEDRPEILKISESKSLLHFSRGKWIDYADKEISELTMLAFSDDKNLVKKKLYDEVDTSGKKEIVIHGGEYIAVFLAPDEYAPDDGKLIPHNLNDILNNLRVMVSKKVKGILENGKNWQWKNSEYWKRFEFITCCRKPYDLEPVKIPDDGGDPEVSTLVHITDGENNV